MNFEYDDRRAISTGRYLRAARFPVVDPALTLASYEGILQLQWSKLNFLQPHEITAVQEMVERVLKQMLCLPAASTHHHKTAGGLFFHSLETAALAVEMVHSGDAALCAKEEVLLVAFIAGLLHDIGKTVATFHVYPHTADIQDVGFGYLDDPVLAHQRWNPQEENLWEWSRRNNVTHLALHYQRSAALGHEAAAGNGFWRRFVPEEVVDAIIVREPYMLGWLEGFLEGKRFGGEFNKLIRKADRVSVQRDVNPLYRTSPKRSDLHLVRRFIEFSAISSWNNTASPFIMADVWVDGRDLNMYLPMFRTRTNFFKTFRDYLFSEDMYGASIRDDASDDVLCEMLEKQGVLRRSLPGTEAIRPLVAEPQYLPAFNAVVQYPGGDIDEAERECLSYFPMGARMAWLGMPDVRVIL